MALMGCTSQKKLETTDIPFKIDQSSFQKWSGGREESGSGAELKIIISGTLKDMSFEKVYFRGRSLDCTLKTENGLSAIVASHETNNILIDKDGKKMQEVFKLQPNEAVLAFKKGDDKLKYAKVKSIKEIAPILYKGRQRN